MNREQGFTLIEILVSLAIFAIVVVGALGVLGAAGSGGFLEGFPTGFVATRAARDTTAAAVYLQAFQEHAASQGSLFLVPGTYCQGPGCATENLSSSGLTACPSPPTQPCPSPPGQPYQLDWRKLEVTITRWYACFNMSTIPPTFVKYSTDPGVGCTVDTAKESMVLLHAKLTWQFRNVPRSIEVDRFLP